jgi:hypothetical protein
MDNSLSHGVAQVFVDAKQPGYQGVLEVISFLVITAMIVGAYFSAATLLVLRCLKVIA